MKYRNTYIYATVGDISRLFELMEKSIGLTYTHNGTFDNPPEETFCNISDILKSPSVIYSPALHTRYLICFSGRAFVYETHTGTYGERMGISRYSQDERQNPDTISLEPGGIVQEKYIAEGSFWTSSRDESIIALYKAIVKELKKRSKHVHRAWLCEEAQLLVESGKYIPEYASK